MIATVGWIIFGVIFLIFFLIFAVRVHVIMEFDGEFRLSVSFLGIRIRILPVRKKKKYKLGNYTPKKIQKRALAAEKKAQKQLLKEKEKAKKKKESDAKKAALTKEEKKAKKLTFPAILAIVRLGKRLLGIFFPRFFKHIHIKIARLHIRIGSADAATTAMMYGAAYQGMEALLAMLRQIVHLHSVKNTDFRLEPAFTEEAMDIDMHIDVSVRLGSIVGLLLRVAFKGLLGFVRILSDDNQYLFF